jgi:predicted enzyme related to lactoylglutathione lyase
LKVGSSPSVKNTPHRRLTLLKFIESVVFFVDDIDGAANWYARLLGSEVRYENPRYAFVQGPGVLLGFHPADDKCPGGVGGTTVYWEVDDLHSTVAALVQKGAKLHRGPGTTSFGAGAAMLVCPFGCTIGLNASTPTSRAALSNATTAKSTLGA